MAHQFVNPDSLYPARGFSHAAVAEGIRTVYFSGIVGQDKDRVVAGNTLESQTVAAMENIKVAMDQVGVTWANVVRRTIFTTQPHEFLTIAAAIASVTGPDDHPTQSLIGVTGLAKPEFLVEIECTAVLP